MKTNKHFRKSHKAITPLSIMCATHWIDPETKEAVKLTHTLKAVYSYQLAQYHGFRKADQIYHESQQRVADMLGIDITTLKKHIVPILKKMGLLRIVEITPRKYITIVFDLSNLKGSLINDNIGQYTDKNRPEHMTDIDPETLKNIKNNLKEIESIKRDLKSDRKKPLFIVEGDQ
jgi:hypothetical protein